MLASNLTDGCDFAEEEQTKPRPSAFGSMPLYCTVSGRTGPQLGGRDCDEPPVAAATAEQYARVLNLIAVGLDGQVRSCQGSLVYTVYISSRVNNDRV